MSKQKQAQPDQLAEYQQQVKQFRDLIDRAAEHNKLQLSNKALSSLLRGITPKAVQTLFQLLDSDNDNVRLGASKTILSKTLPDLKAIEHSSKEGIQGLVIVQKDDNEQVIDAELVDVEQANSTD